MKKEFDKYFLGTLSDEEKVAFFDRIESDKDCKSEFIHMQHTVSVSQLYNKKGDRQYATEMMKELNRRIQLKRRHRMIWNIAKYAAVIALLVINGWLVRDKIIVSEEEDLYTTIEVPKGQRVSMTLPDGTEVWLSPRTVLQIPDKFNKKNRSVKLDGEGYFSVVKNEKIPFIVEAKQHQVKVLGTRFNLFAYSESSRFETDLLSGKIELAAMNSPKKSILLNAGERAILQDNHFVKMKSFFDNEEYLKNGIFSFRNKPFEEILEYMALWYDVKFEIKDSVKKELLISGKFRQGDEVKNIMKALRGVHKFNYKEISEQKMEIY